MVNNTRSILHPKVLLAKAEYYIKCYLVEITDDKSDYRKFSKLEDLLSNAVRLTEAKKTLTFAKLVNVWEKNGPVVAKLYTWIRNQESRTENGEPRATCVTYFYDYYNNYDNELSIHITCGDMDVKWEGKTAGCC